MINITTLIVDRTDLVDNIKKLIGDRYSISAEMLDEAIVSLEEYIGSFIDNLWFVVEHPYVDKLYRDSYYNYYSSKLGDYSRDSIKISIFNEEVTADTFISIKAIENTIDHYLGFLTLRPTFPSIIGRSVLSPRLFKVNNFVICSTNFNVTVNGIKFISKGFPHSSQDAETISCAETTIWSLLEYFSHRYPEYRPVLPSQITKILNKHAVERLIPSKGLSASSISYTLKELGFGVKIYARKSYGSNFDNLLKTYVESGIPIIGAMTNQKGIGHAFNIIGREIPNDADIDNIQAVETVGTPNGNLEISDYYTMPLKYVFIDDNHSPYQLTSIDKPSAYYSNPIWQDCEITMFIAPLYPKIYLEADTARRLANTYIKQFKSIGLFSKSDVVLKTFLTSSRSYKEYVAVKSDLDATVRDLLSSTSMPKFIWVTELSDKNLLKQLKCYGVILIDATEPKKEGGIVASFFENSYISYDFSKFNIITLPLQPFNSYTNNLN